jgi:hypothetical protein
MQVRYCMKCRLRLSPEGAAAFARADLPLIGFEFLLFFINALDILTHSRLLYQLTSEVPAPDYRQSLRSRRGVCRETRPCPNTIHK